MNLNRATGGWARLQRWPGPGAEPNRVVTWSGRGLPAGIHSRELDGSAGANWNIHTLFFVVVFVVKKESRPHQERERGGKLPFQLYFSGSLA